MNNNQDYEQQSQQIKCISQGQAYLVCKNQQCTKKTFICIKQDCQCHAEHPNCIKSTKKSLTTALQAKLVSYRKIQNKIKQEIKKGIIKLTQFQQYLLKQCEEKFQEFVGLTDFQKEFMNAIKLGKIDKVTGKTIWTIELNIKLSEKITQMMDKLEQDVNKFCKKFQQNIQQFHFDITDRLQMFGSGIFEESKVLTTRKQGKIIEGFFQSQGQRIKSVKLLYRGSQQGFTVGNFHKLCDGQTQTITFCENTYGKKFGGYTSIAWNNTSNTYVNDATGKQFVFSLSNNHKFTQATVTNTIHCHSSHGPTFGGYDMHLAQKCHQNFNSYCNINTNYQNTNYQAGTIPSYTLMTGGQQNYNFKVKQYEVWKIEFVA